jgi:hypothetical protein
MVAFGDQECLVDLRFEVIVILAERQTVFG